MPDPTSAFIAALQSIFDRGKLMVGGLTVAAGCAFLLFGHAAIRDVPVPIGPELPLLWAGVALGTPLFVFSAAGFGWQSVAQFVAASNEKARTTGLHLTPRVDQCTWLQNAALGQTEFFIELQAFNRGTRTLRVVSAILKSPRASVDDYRLRAALVQDPFATRGAWSANHVIHRGDTRSVKVTLIVGKLVGRAGKPLDATVVLESQDGARHRLKARLKWTPPLPPAPGPQGRDPAAVYGYRGGA